MVSTNKPKLLYLSKRQFGYSIDTYYHCKYLKENFDITVLCTERGKKKIRLDDVKVIYYKPKDIKIVREFLYIYQAIKILIKNKYQLSIINRFRMSFILGVLCNWKTKFVLDIRSGNVNQSNIRRIFENYLIKLDSMVFSNVSIISNSLSEYLGISNYTNYILPLGADILSDKKKTFDAIKLLYIGTLSNRKILDTLEGFKKFYCVHKNNIQIQYTIIGYGSQKEEKEIEEFIKHNDLDNAVDFVGRKNHKEAKRFFDTHNIGISYIPKTKYFDVQPPTKTFEYLLSGMPVIATDTTENSKVIDESNGILIDDNANAFYRGLREIYENLSSFDSEKIRRSVNNHKWENIVRDFNHYLHEVLGS